MKRKFTAIIFIVALAVIGLSTTVFTVFFDQAVLLLNQLWWTPAWNFSPKRVLSLREMAG